MPDKPKATAVLTGSTDRPIQDMTPRAAFIAFAGGFSTVVCIAIGADAALTGAVVTTASTGAVLAAACFDATIKKRL